MGGRFFLSLWLTILAFHSGARAFANGPTLTWDTNQKISIEQESGVRFFWWNIHDGSVNVGGPREDFQNNLSALIHSNIAPDVLVFGEYEQAALGIANIRDMAMIYPYHQNFPYPEAVMSVSSGYGLGVYSKYPFQVSSVDAIGSRSLVILKFELQGQALTFVPVHIEDVWPAYEEENGAWKLIEQVFVGTNNAVWDQIVQFRAVLESRLGEQLSQKNFVMMGDFNSVKPGRGYDRISWGLSDAIHGFDPTFPASTSDYQKDFPIQVQIDHPFMSVGTNVKSAQILPLRGSDHYALDLIVAP